MPIFTIGSRPTSLVNKFTDGSDYQDGDSTAAYGSDYARPLFKILGFGVSHMHIDLASVILMSILVIVTLNSRFKK